MMMKFVAQEEPAIYKVLREQASAAAQSPRVGKLREFVAPRREKVHPQDALHLPYVGLEQVEAHTMRLLGTVDASSMKSAANRFFPGDVLYGRLRPYLNKVYLAKFEGICSPEFIVMPRTAGLDPQYLRYRLNAHDFVAFARHLNAGDRPRVDFEQICDFTVSLPSEARQAQTVAYLDEQLSRLDAGVAALHRVQANLKRYRASVLKAACEGRLVPTEAELARQEGRNFETGAQLLQRILVERRMQHANSGKFREPTCLEATPPEAPAGWSWCSLDQIAVEMRNGFGGKPKGDSGTRILRISAVRALTLDMNDIRHLPGQSDLYASDLLHTDDLLFTRYNGSRAFVGVCAVVPSLTEPTAHPDKLIKVRCVASLALPSFVALMASCGVSRAFLESRMRTTAGQPGISGGDLKSLPIPLPPLAEQHRIVAEVDRRLSLIRVAEAQVSANLARAQRLRQSILQAAFRTPAQAGQ